MVHMVQDATSIQIRLYHVIHMFYNLVDYNVLERVACSSVTILNMLHLVRLAGRIDTRLHQEGLRHCVHSSALHRLGGRAL